MHLRQLNIALALALMTAGCGQPGASQASLAADNTQAPSDKAPPMVTPVKKDKGVDTPDKADPHTASQAQPDQNREVLIREITGNWVIEKLWVDTSGVTAYALDDPAAVGSVMTITPDAISWAKAASDQFSSADRCGGPAPMIIRDAAAAKATGAPLAGAVAYFNIPRNELGPLHEMGCLDSGNWGPEAAGGSNFYLASGGRMVMSWYDGAVLLLRRQ